MPRPYHHGDLENALIEAGAALLAAGGVSGLTLREVARRAGVSPAAPYAHFRDKEALVAAIAADGLRQVRARLAAAARPHAGAPARQLLEAAWAVVRFGLTEPDRYRVTFSPALEREHDHPEYVATAHAGFDDLVRLVEACQAAGALPPGPADVAATGVWSLVHGLVSLLGNAQIPRRVLARGSPRALLEQVLGAHLRAPAPAPRPARRRAPAPTARGAASRRTAPAAPRRRPSRRP